MSKNITIEEIAAVVEEDGVEYLLSEHMNPDDAKDSRVRTVLRAIRKDMNALFRMLDIEEIRGIIPEDGVEEDMETDDDSDLKEIAEDAGAPDGED